MGLGRLGPIGPTLLFALVVIVNTIMWAIDDVLYTRIGEFHQRVSTVLALLCLRAVQTVVCRCSGSVAATAALTLLARRSCRRATVPRPHTRATV